MSAHTAVFNVTEPTYGFTIPFPYMDPAHVSMSINGVTVPVIIYERTASWLVNGDVAPVQAGATVTLRRTTPTDTPPVTFTDGAPLTAAALNVLATYASYLAQEGAFANLTDAQVSAVNDALKFGTEAALKELLAEALNDIPSIAGGTYWRLTAANRGRSIDMNGGSVDMPTAAEDAKLPVGAVLYVANYSTLQDTSIRADGRLVYISNSDPVTSFMLAPYSECRLRKIAPNKWHATGSGIFQ